MRPALPLFLCCLLGVSACAASQMPPKTGAQTGAQSQPEARDSAAAILDQAARALREMRAATPRKALDHAIEDARALIVLPGVYQAGFFFSVHGGSGVLVARRPDGGWGAPVFVSLGGAGYGVQAGLERSRLVLAVMEEEMLARILQSGLNFDASVKYDILNVREEHSQGSLTEGRPVAVFADGMGLMAGVALRGGVLSVNQTLTQRYHGTAQNPAEIMRGASAPSLEAFAFWNALVVEEQKESIIRP